jgi:phosphoglycerol transferase MdoB-like AlkP superfamily enzyme
MNCAPAEIIDLSKQLSRLYNRVPSVEVWNTECVNAAITQIEFYKDSGYFSAVSDIKLIYDSLEETLNHLKNEVEFGSKFMPEDGHELKKNNFTFYFNRVLLVITPSW